MQEAFVVPAGASKASALLRAGPKIQTDVQVGQISTRRRKEPKGVYLGGGWEPGTVAIQGYPGGQADH